MSLHYNAFISYKHAPLDNKVAAEIEKQLERYHIPKKIQKKTGVKKIERIFRDKDELPITSDLTDTINEALLNSDYLIVLCSKSTHLSTWVEREINLFLQTHPLDHVLTVLAEGEPYEVIPKVLLSRQVQRYNSFGQVETVIEPVEPLSCDWRLPRKEAINTELPRLAAALVGCSYNELMNRQRQYKMRRLSAIAAGVMGLSIGFGAYMLYSNQKINENYQKALINQSKYLANASEDLLEDEMRTDALHLALESLPNEKNPDRPVIPEAERAILKASNAYFTQRGFDLISAWNYTMPDSVEKYVFSYEGRSFAAIDRSHNIKAWDCATHELLFEYSSNTEEAKNIAYLGTEELLITGSSFMKVINVTTGECIWQKATLERANKDSILDTVSIAGDIIRLNDGTFLVRTYHEGVFRINAADGEVVDNYTLPLDSLLYSSEEIDNFCVSPDQTKLALLCKLGDDSVDSLVIYDMASKEYYGSSIGTDGFYDPSNDFIDHMKWIDDGLYISVIKNSLDTSFRFGSMYSLSDSHHGIHCFNIEDLSHRWENDFVYNSIGYGSDFLEFSSQNAVMFYCGNICELWDQDTGELIKTYNATESIVKVHPTKNGESFSIITREGKWANPAGSGEDTSLTATTYFNDDIYEAVINNGVYTRTKGSKEIIYYATGENDENYQDFASTPEMESIYKRYIDDDYLAILNSDDTETFVDIFDVQTKEYLGRSVVGPDSKYRYEFIGIDGGIVYVLSEVEKGFTLCKTDIASMTTETVTLVEGSYTKTYGQPVVKNGKLVFYDSSQYDHKVAVVYDVASGNRQEFELSQEYDGFKCRFQYCPEKNMIYFSGKFDYILNTETGEATSITNPAGWNGTHRVYIDPEKEILLKTDNTKILICDLSGKELSSVQCPDLDVLGLTIYHPENADEKAQILSVTSDGFLYRYDLESGEYIAQSELTYCSTSEEMTFEFDFEKGRLYIHQDYIQDIVDVESWIELTYVVGALGYHQETDSFIVYTYSNTSSNKIGYCKEYTLEELIQKANDMLEGSEMSEDFKNNYGIG